MQQPRPENPLSPRDRAIDFIWISLAVLFFALAGLHVYLAVTSILEVKLPERAALSETGVAEPFAAAMDTLNKEISSSVNTFIVSYNRSSRLSNLFGACGYVVAGVTCVFCLILNRKPS